MVLLSHIWWRGFTVPDTKVAPFPQLMWGVVFTACVVYLLFTQVLCKYMQGIFVQR